MDDTLQILANPSHVGLLTEGKVYRITKENAREFAQRGWEARRKREFEQKELANRALSSTPQSTALAKQIKQLEDLMDGETDADVLAKLAGAHSKLFATWQVLTGTPNPGSRRVKGSRPSSASVETVQVVSDSGTVGQ